MKVVQVLPFFLPDYVGGTEVYCWSLCKYLQSRGVDVEVLIPHYRSTETTRYVYDGIPVTKYAEPTELSKAVIAGLVPPEGLKVYKALLAQLKPDIVHFHGIYGSVGITVPHIAAARELGCRTLYTMHLANHVCRTQTLVYKGRDLCDGVIRPYRCASCALQFGGVNGVVGRLLPAVSYLLAGAGADTAKWNTRLGTGLSAVNRIRDLQRDLITIAEECDKVVVIAKWFEAIMRKNGFPADRLAFIAPALTYSADRPGEEEPVRFHRPDTLRLIFIGRLFPTKGLDLLLRAMAGLPEEKIELSIYGKDDDADYFRQCQALAAGKKNIHWRGVAPREKVMAIFSQHDAL
ncbi:MAG TPA: glycosyltransferase family 4 protein, partial [Puia sp.]|nr:glycosyltransferase family 4 protein [Puia sp.]